MILIHNPVLWLSIKLFKRRWITFLFYLFILISLLQIQTYFKPIVLLPYLCFLAVLKMLTTEYLRGHEETLVILGFSIEKVLTKTVQAVFLCSFCMSIVAILISLTILYNTGNMPGINIMEILFMSGLYMPLLPVGRFLLKRLILHKSKGGGGWSYIVEIGLALFIVLLHELLPVIYCLIIFLVVSILALGFEKRFLPKSEWNVYFERSMR